MFRSKLTAAAVCAALVLGGGLTLATTAAPAHAQTFFYEQCDTNNACMNLWNGGPYVQTWYGTTGNNDIMIQYLPNRGGGFQLVNMVEGYPNCIGDFDGLSNDARLSGFDQCNNPNTGYGGAWGTVFYAVRDGCPPGPGGEVPVEYQSAHWPGGYINHAGSGNDRPWYENSSPDCMTQLQYING